MRFLNNPLSALFAVGISTASASSLPEIGETKKEVIQRFGEPQSELGNNEIRILNFESCSIQLRDGTVVSVNPKQSPRQTPEQIQAKRLEFATRQYKRYSNNEHVIRLSPQARLDFWKRFQHQHPAIDVSEEILTAKKQWQQELSLARTHEFAQFNQQHQAQESIKEERKSYKRRSYTRRYVVNKSSSKKSKKSHGKKERTSKTPTVVRFFPTRGIPAITGVKPIVTQEFNRTP
ncbi:hypothetical protein MLD52_17010 [Puniceicoccaceae bacterium K14]|nr:hypothetical protein [Puniceicoccaceae bacterium K14]